MVASAVERVYIGGLEKDRLQVAEVLDRLSVNLQDAVEIVDRHEGSTYLHVNVRSKQSEKSAFESIKSQFHNVKWKGCRLKVELAKPHYLERLAEERRQRNQGNTDLVCTENKFMSAREHALGIPRHLKIRRGYGEQHWRVDTRPFDVESWDTFRKLLTRVAKKQQGTGETGGQWNRAIHLRFESGVHSATVVDENSEDESKVSSDDSVCDSIGSSSSIDSSRSENSGQAAHVGRYVWSDDEDSTDSASNKDGTFPAQSSAKSKDATGNIPDDSSDHGFDQNQLSDSEERKWPGDSKYVWSDDEHTSEEEPPVSKEMSKRTFLKAINEVDEFAAAMDEEGDFSAEGFSSDVQPVMVPKSTDVREDVENNLKILTEIFPDLSARLPHDVDKKESLENADAGQRKSMMGWGESGQMLRYDPSQNSADRFLQQQKGAHKDSNVMEKSEADGDESSSKREHESKEENENANRQINDADHSVQDGDIYRQADLEQVFKDAREVHERSIIVESNAATNDSGMFSFGFQVDNQTGPSEATGPFSFSFPLSTVNNQVARDKAIEPNHLQSAEGFDTIEPAPKKKRLIGWCLPEKDVDEMVDYFFSMNDGDRIMDDLDAFRKDAAIQETWNKERRILTEDWKRKRKYAVSRKGKRFR